MITREELNQLQSELQNFSAIPNETDAIEKKRNAIMSIKNEIAEKCPFVKDYEPFPNFGIMSYFQAFVVYNLHHYSDVEHFIEKHFNDIVKWEHMDQKTKDEYAAKLREHTQTVSISFSDSSGVHPDQIFTQGGIYRKYASYLTSTTYQFARKLKKDLDEKGISDFSLYYRTFLLYSAAFNDLFAVEKAMRRMGYIIVEAGVTTRDAVPSGDPYDCVKPFRNPNADPYIYYNFWGASLKKKQEQYKGKEPATGDQKATYLANYNKFKLQLEFERLFQNARASVINELPESTKKEVEFIINKLLADFIARVRQDFGSSFVIMSEKLSDWDSRTVDAAHEAELRVPTIVCYDEQSNGETSSSSIQRYIVAYSHQAVHDQLLKIAFPPKVQSTGLLRYDFWGDDYGWLVEKHKGQRGLPDDLRALFNQDDNTALFVKKVKDFIDIAETECSKAGWHTDVQNMPMALAKAKEFYQDQFFKYIQRLNDLALSEEEINNASLGWLFFTRRTVGRIRWEGLTYTNPPVGKPNMSGLYFSFAVIGSGGIFDDMKRRFLEESFVTTPEVQKIYPDLFTPLGNMQLKLDRLYAYLNRSDERVVIVSKSDFEYAVKNADFNKLLEDAKELHSTVKVKILIQILRPKFPKEWYTAVSQNCNIPKKSLKKINYDRTVYKNFKRCLEGIPLT